MSRWSYATALHNSERVGYADGQTPVSAARCAAAPVPVAQRRAVHELRDEILPTFEFADVVNRDDMRVVQRRGGLSSRRNDVVPSCRPQNRITVLWRRGAETSDSWP